MAPARPIMTLSRHSRRRVSDADSDASSIIVIDSESQGSSIDSKADGRRKAYLRGLCHALTLNGKYKEAEDLLDNERVIERSDIYCESDIDMLLLMVECKLALDPTSDYFFYQKLHWSLLSTPMSTEELQLWGTELYHNNRFIASILLFHAACRKLYVENPRRPDYAEWMSFLHSHMYLPAVRLLKADEGPRFLHLMERYGLFFMTKILEMVQEDRRIEQLAKSITEATCTNYVVCVLYYMGRYDEAQDRADKAIKKYKGMLDMYSSLEKYRVYGDLLFNSGKLNLKLDNVGLAYVRFSDAVGAYEKAVTRPYRMQQKLLATAKFNMSLTHRSKPVGVATY